MPRTYERLTQTGEYNPQTREHDPDVVRWRVRQIKRMQDDDDPQAPIEQFVVSEDAWSQEELNREITRLEARAQRLKDDRDEILNNRGGWV